MRDLMKEKVYEMKKTLILEGVSRYFEEVGFYGATMQEIAKNLGLSVGALYKFFPSKEALFYGYIEFQIRVFQTSVTEECASIAEPRKCLELFVQRTLETMVQKKAALADPVIGDPLFFVKLSEPGHNPSRPLLELLSGWFDKLASEIRFCTDDTMMLAYMFKGATGGYIEYWLNGGALPHSAAEVVDRFLKGTEIRG